MSPPGLEYELCPYSSGLINVPVTSAAPGISVLGTVSRNAEPTTESEGEVNLAQQQLRGGLPGRQGHLSAFHIRMREGGDLCDDLFCILKRDERLEV